MLTRKYVRLTANMCQLGLILTLALILTGCSSDAATRLAYDLEREAKTLLSSGDKTLAFTHKPQGPPDGVTGAYTVTFKGGPLGQGFLAFSKGSHEVWTHTSYHLRFVEVPKDLRIRKGDGESFVVVLAKIDGAVHVTELR
jgi:hypothetical protein